MLTLDKVAARNLTIFLGSSTISVAAVLLAPGLPEMARAFEDTPNAEFLVRLTLTMPALFVAIGAPLSGILLDRWGRKPVLVAGLLLYALSGVSGFVLDSLSAILVGRAFLGLASGGILNGCTTLIADYYPRMKLGQFIGYQGAFIGSAGVISQLLGGFLADLDWRLPFLIYLYALLLLPAVLWAIDEPAPQAITEAKDAHKSKSAAFPLRTVALVYSIVFVGMMLFFVFPVHIPFFLTDAGSSTSQVGMALALQTLVSVAVAAQFGRLKARLSFEAVLALAFFVMGINFLIVAATSAYATVVVGLMIGGISVGILPTVANVWVASVTPVAQRGLVLGGVATAIFLGQFLTPVVTQPIIDQSSLSSMFGLVGIVSLALTTALIGIELRRRTSSPNV